jgi:hypothetical protein
MNVWASSAVSMANYFSALATIKFPTGESYNRTMST